MRAAVDHPLRQYHRGSPTVSPRQTERAPPPAPRTHATICAEGLANEQHTAAVLAKVPRTYKKDAPYKVTGVKQRCALRFLPLFDIIWDILPDMMHIVPVLWKGHVFKLFNGTRMPTQVKVRKTWSAAANAQLLKDHEIAKAHTAGWQLTPVRQLPCVACCMLFEVCVDWACVCGCVLMCVEGGPPHGSPVTVAGR